MPSTFKIGRREIGEGAPVYIIAELSANHGGSLDRALQTIEAAAKAGADAIKLQTYTADTLTLKSGAPPFVVRTKNEWSGRTLHDLYTEAMTPWEWHPRLKEAAEALGLDLFSTPFDPTATQFLHGLGVEAYKIASFEIVDLPLVEHVARRGKPMIISTGMASLGEIDAAVRVCRDAGNDAIALLRCVSAYPADPAVMNLQSFATMRGFGTVVGLSDHTRDETVVIASVALGAKIIEKHFIVDRSTGGPDAFFSLEPAEFSAMVKAVRVAESAMGPPRFGASSEERASLAFRRSLFVARDVKAGEVLTCDNVRSVRPSHGLAPRNLPAVLGRLARQDVTAGTPLTWDAVGAEPSPRLELRAATADDGPRLLAWRTDAATRSMSTRRDEVTHDEHAAWLARSLGSPDREILIAYESSEKSIPIGQVRLDRGEHGRWTTSITVAPEARGQGFATRMLVAAERRARALGVASMCATIRRENERSVRAFKRAGYYAFVERDADDGMYLDCERRLSPYNGE